MLAALYAGQVIDTDDVSGITFSVKNIGQDENGKNTVVLQAANKRYSAEATYDEATCIAIALSESTLDVDSNEYTNLKLVQKI